MSKIEGEDSSETESEDKDGKVTVDVKTDDEGNITGAEVKKEEKVL